MVQIIGSLKVKWIQKVLSDGDEVVGLLVYQGQELEDLYVKWEVFDVLGQLDHSNHELDDWVDQQDQLSLVLADGQDPKLDAVVELPTVDGFDCVLGHIIPDVSQMQAQLSDEDEP